MAGKPKRFMVWRSMSRGNICIVGSKASCSAAGAGVAEAAAAMWAPVKAPSAAVVEAVLGSFVQALPT